MDQATASKVSASSASVNIADYVARQRVLLQAERDAELAEVSVASSDSVGLAALEAAGLAATRLSLVGRSSAPGGRVTLSLATRGGRVLDAPRLSTGDIVAVRPQRRETGSSTRARRPRSGAEADGSAAVEGVLTVLEETRVEVVVDVEVVGDNDKDGTALALSQEGAGGGQQLFAVVHVGSDVTYKRYSAALTEFERAVDDPTHHAYAALGVLFRGAEPRYQPESSLSLVVQQTQLMVDLNESQQGAIRHAMCAKELAVIHGPPGTGKTSTLVAFIVMEVLRGSRLLVVAPSNIAVDNIAEKLAASPTKVRFVRAGHPARVMPPVVEHTLESRLAQTDDAALARDVSDELANLEQRVKTARPDERRTIRTEQRHLRKELRKREGDALRRLLARVDVVLATTSGAGARILDYATKEAPFDVVCVDEAGQALECACLVALLRGKRTVIAGDPFQLAPTMRSATSATALNAGETILDRVFSLDHLRSAVVRVLNVQYRMNAIVSNWSSDALYGGQVVPAEAVSGHLLAHLPNVIVAGRDDPELSDINQAWVLIDTAGCDFHESFDGDDDIAPRGAAHMRTLIHASISNAGESEVVVSHVQGLLSQGVKPTEIGVISPYSGQVKLLRARLREFGMREVEVATVDSFQGREKEAIIISCVRSNLKGTVGFLADNRRMNVAVTRARRHVCIVCDSATVSQDEFLSSMVDYASEHGDYRAANPNLGMVLHSSNVHSGRPSVVELDDEGTGPRKVPDSGRSRKKASQPGVPARIGDTGSKHPIDSTSTKRGQSDSSSEALRNRIDEDIAQFVRDPTRSEYAFDSSLSSFGRRIVHAAAERLRLDHVAQGEGLDRYVVIRKSLLSAEARGQVKGKLCTLPIPIASPAQGVGFAGLRDELDVIESHGSEGGGQFVSDTRPRQVPDPKEKACLSSQDEVEKSDTNSILREAGLARQERAQIERRTTPSKDAVPPPADRGSGGPQARTIVNGVLMDGQFARTAASSKAAKSRLQSKLSEASASRKPRKSKK